MNILVVDDNESNLYQMEALLSGNSYQVTTAMHGAEALEKARQNPPDLIISDILMPVMDGFSLCRAWKLDERLKNIPFVFYTATYTDDRDREFALSLGAQRFIVKPEEPDVFVHTIREVIEQVKNPTPGSTAPPSAAPVQLPIVAPEEEDTIYLLQYNEVLIRKLEQKMEQLEKANRELKLDIIERKVTEELLREQAALLNAANDAIYVRKADNTITFWNDGAERLYGWARSEVLGHKMTDLFGSVGREAFEAAHASLLEQGSWSGELTKTDKTGKERVVFCRWTLLRDEQGRPKEILAINTDITEKKQLETNFFRAQRMEGIGALAGGIAHDLNNILQPILMTAPLMRQTVRDPESRALLDTIENCAKRGADIIKQLLTFARGTPSVRVPLPVYHLMSDVGKIIRETFPRNIQLTVTAPKDLWLVIGDATQIHQALMNLCVNARDAMPKGGTLTLEAKNLTLNEAFAAMRPNAKPGDYICVSVSDTGIGIPPENLDRIFDPFFTTKELGKGTGLGLATVLGIVRGHGGFVQVNSREGHGTTFELYLPASPQAKTADKSDTEHLPREMHGEMILVVDDESAVRSVIQRTLEKHGYRVVTAAEGNEALALFAKNDAEIKAVITDVMMPGKDGLSLIQVLRKLNPRLPILSITGLGEQANVKAFQDLGLPVLLKPFARGELLAALHQAIAVAAEQDSIAN